MPEIYIAPAKRRFTVSQKTWNLLAVHKVFWPPTSTVAFGKRIVEIKDIYPWPTIDQITITPADQGTLLDVPVVEKKKEVNMG